ncbi:hypothetical protein AAC387_Pa05g1066 [Persea americana]
MTQGGATDGYFDEYGYDAVVVGFGYGGAVAACRLAMAGIKVCLIEKGKKWEANDFPTYDYQMWSKMRLESGTDGVSFGPKDALFQTQTQALLPLQRSAPRRLLSHPQPVMGLSSLPSNGYQVEKLKNTQFCCLMGIPLRAFGVQLSPEILLEPYLMKVMSHGYFK